jgi:hypothetical protein
MRIAPAAENSAGHLCRSYKPGQRIISIFYETAGIVHRLPVQEINLKMIRLSDITCSSLP